MSTEHEYNEAFLLYGRTFIKVCVLIDKTDVGKFDIQLSLVGHTFLVVGYYAEHDASGLRSVRK